MSDKKDLSIYIEAIQARFAVTDDENKATHKLTTKEVTDAINELNPSCAASPQDIYDAMFEAGFVFRAPRGTSGLRFKWLLIEKIISKLRVSIRARSFLCPFCPDPILLSLSKRIYDYR